jgi:hypothetical protein
MAGQTPGGHRADVPAVAHDVARMDSVTHLIAVTFF